MSTAELDAQLDLILDALPEYHGDGERRKHALTKSDMGLIVTAIRVSAHNQPCSLSFTKEQAEDILKMVKERRRVLILIGAGVSATLAFIGQKTIEAMAPDLWKRVAHWLVVHLGGQAT